MNDVRPLAAQSHGWFGEGLGCAANETEDVAIALRASAARGAPCALIDDQQRGEAILFTEPSRIFTTHAPQRLPALLSEMRRAMADGATLVGLLSYRAGEVFDAMAARSSSLPPGATSAPLLWFATFAQQHAFATRRGGDSIALAPLRPAIGRARYEDMVRQALKHIRGGDLYQVNLTFPATIDIDDPIAFYGCVRERARAPFGAFIQTGDRHILSFSPELFFHMRHGQIEARPMKGTARRGCNATADRKNARQLSTSSKDRAENLMIVDLLRNDMSRVCVPGSVKVPRLFDLEPYPGVWQMTSTIAGRLRAGIDSLAVLEAMFPCGSITGAPKIMATRVIAELEGFDRGVYTGSIGMMSAERAAFNVAIRTADHSGGKGRIDLGAGIVADSRPRAEWMECLAKARFLLPR